MAQCPILPIAGHKSGSLGPVDAGGVTASHNRGGPYCRLRVTPTDTQTIWRRQTRDLMAHLWGDLWRQWQITNPDRIRRWANSPARPPKMTPWNWFCAVNLPRARVPFALLQEPPNPAPPPTWTTTPRLIWNPALWTSQGIAGVTGLPLLPPDPVAYLVWIRPKVPGAWWFIARGATATFGVVEWGTGGVDFPPFLANPLYETRYDARVKPIYQDGRIGPVWQTSAVSPPESP